jgi:hypothetical protein
MSHIVQIATEVRDEQAAIAACRRLGLAPPTRGAARLFESEAVGLLVALPGWLYPVVVDTNSGAIRYDNYGGRWGEPAELGRFLQAYALEKATIEARRRGHSVVEQALPDGSIKLTIRVGGVS